VEFRDILRRKKIKVVEKPKRVKKSKLPDIPKDLWGICPYCKKIVYIKDIEENQYVCNHCGAYWRLSCQKRISYIIDEGTFKPFNFDIPFSNPLGFPQYEEKVKKCQEETGLDEAVLCGVGKIYGEKCVICVMDSRFIMGSMGYGVGERITRSIEYAQNAQLPLIIFTASGGARMQEGMVSLMQMAKVSGALKKFSECGLLYVSVLTDPTTGGVTASFASLGDIILAEKGALIGFAGKRVIEQTIKQEIPKNFQTAEFLFECGFVDMVVERHKMKDVLWKILTLHKTG